MNMLRTFEEYLRLDFKLYSKYFKILEWTIKQYIRIVFISWNCFAVSQTQVSIENRKLFSALKYVFKKYVLLSILRYNLYNNIYIVIYIIYYIYSYIIYIYI